MKPAGANVGGGDLSELPTEVPPSPLKRTNTLWAQEILPQIPTYDEDDVPFKHIPYSCGDWLSLIFHIVTGLLIVKIVLLAISLLFAYVFFWLALCGSTSEEDGYVSEPHTAFRNVMVWCGIKCFRVTPFLMGTYWITTKWQGDSYKMFKQGHFGIVVCNHVSIWDPYIIASVFGLISAVGKAEIMKYPILGTAAKATQMIPAYRRDPKLKALTKKRIAERAHDTGSPPMIIFPQGTTTPEKKMTVFKWGAFKHGTPITPITIEWPEHFGNLQNWSFNLRATFHGLCRFYTPVRVRILETYHPSDAEINDPSSYADNVRMVMKNTLGDAHELSPFNYDDYRLHLHAQKVRNPPPSGQKGFTTRNICLADLKTTFHLKTQDVMNYAQVFAEADINGSGVINYEELCLVLVIDDTPFSKRLFHALDKTKQESVRFVDILALSAVCKSPDHSKDALRVFHYLLENSNGTVEKDSLNGFAKAFPSNEQYADIVNMIFADASDDPVTFQQLETSVGSNARLLQTFLNSSIFGRSTFETIVVE